VDELLRVALDTAGPPSRRKDWARALRVDQPLQPFSARAFDGRDGRDRSFDASSLAMLRRMAAPRVDRPFAPTGAQAPGRASGPARAVGLDELLAFWKDPAKAFLRARGMDAPRDPEDPSEDDDEAMDLAHGLRGWQLNQRVLAEAFSGGDPHLLERLAADRLLPPGRLGRLRGGQVLGRAQALARELEAKAGGRPAAFPCVAQLPKGRSVSGSLMRASAKGVAIAWTSRTADYKPQVRRWDVDPWAVFEAWVKACVAAAAGDAQGLCLGALDEKDATPRLLNLPALKPEDARSTLASLLALRDLGQASLLAFAPKTSHALAEKLLDNDDEDALEKAEEIWTGNDFNPGEASKPAYALAWRGQHPFSGDRAEEWVELARTLWTPVLAWWSQVPGPDGDAGQGGDA
jgi:exodeoxyribonuclease V gamma subunit